MFVATTPFLEDTKTSLSSGQKNGDGLGPRRFVYRTINIDDIKLINNGMKTVSWFHKLQPSYVYNKIDQLGNLEKN